MKNSERKESTGKIAQTQKVPFSAKMMMPVFGLLGIIAPKYGAKLFFHIFSKPRIRAKHRRSDEILESAKKITFISQGLKLQGYEWGSGDRTVLLAHGWESRATALRHFVPVFREMGYRVTGLDAPAHGDSEGDKANMVMYAGAIKDFIGEVGGVDVIVAHSFGGAASMFYLAKNEDKRLKKVVLLAAPADIGDIMEQAMRMMRIPKSIKREFVIMIEDFLGEPISVLNMDKLLSAVKDEKILIIHDKYDDIVPFHHVEKVLKKCKKVEFMITEHKGHFRITRDPLVVKKVQSFCST